MLNDIYLKNFKCFEEMHVELADLNVFAGINSMGKSTVIQSILLLRQAYEMNSLDKVLPLNGMLINLGTGYDVLYRDSDEEKIGISITEDGNLFEWIYKYDKEMSFQKLSVPVNESIDIESMSIFSPGFSYISADRIGPRAFYEKSYSHIYNMNQVGYHGEFFPNYLEEKKFANVKNDKVMHDETKSKQLIYQFEAWLSEISPGIKISPKKYIEAGIVSIGYNVKGREYTPLNVGFGISYTAPIILSLLKASKGDLIILENPEAHLHPRGQRIMGELIAKACSGGVQVIVETHSDHLLNGIRLSVMNKKIDRKKVRLNFFYQEKDENADISETKIKHKKCSPAILEDGSIM